MNLEQQIKDILFVIGQEIILHKIDNENIIIEIDYDKYTADIMQVVFDYFKGGYYGDGSD